MNAVTNFDISRYDVERIMASNTLLAGELARRNKNSEPRTQAIGYNAAPAPDQSNGEAVQVQAQRNNDENGSEWKMLYESNGSDQKTINCGNYRNSAISLALQDLMGIDPVGSGQPMLEDTTTTTKLGAHFSNPSSLVTSLSSSREASPDKSGPTLLFPKPPMASKVVSPIGSGGVSSWFPSPQLRPASAISMSHLPVFAAWNDG